jgi:hypothetical protein
MTITFRSLICAFAPEAAGVVAAMPASGCAFAFALDAGVELELDLDLAAFFGVALAESGA